MSFYTDRKAFFLQLSQTHYLVKHGHPVAEGSEDLRKSYIVIDNPEELTAASLNYCHLPLVVHADYSGKPIDKNGSIRIKNNNELLFLDKPQTSTEDPTITTANDGAYNRSFNVMMDFIAWMNEEFEKSGSCGPFKDFDINLFSWRRQEYISDGFVGWVLTFSDEVKATDILSFDEEKWVELPE